jgi:hypothetical protein
MYEGAMRHPPNEKIFAAECSPTSSECHREVTAFGNRFGKSLSDSGHFAIG